MSQSVRVATFLDHWVIEGPGLDEVLRQDPERKIFLIDDLYGDAYSDYVFLGYEVLLNEIAEGRADLVNIYMGALTLDSGKAIVVCGTAPTACIALLAAHGVVSGKLGFEEALAEASRVVKELYGKEFPLEGPYYMALKTFYKLFKRLGKLNLALLFSVAGNYNYGNKSHLVYGESIVWTDAIGAPDELVLSKALRFLIEGHGKPEELLNYRLDALGGKENLASLVGERPIEIIEKVAKGVEDEETKVYNFVEALKPGVAPIYDIKREGEKLVVICKGECKLDEAYRFLPLKHLGVEELTYRTL